jgi:two-component system, OmpR family, phosphate regulon sensor histidine kinase PhoR
MQEVKEVFLSLFMKKLRWPAISMIIAILAITGFQLYWLKNNYDREKQNLDIKTSSSFRQTILRLQASKLKLENVNFQLDSAMVSDVTVTAKKNKKRTFNGSVRKKEPAITIMNLIEEKFRDSLKLGDSIPKGMAIVSIDKASFSGMNIDSLRKQASRLPRVSLRPLTMPGLDSLHIDPQMIREIKISDDSFYPERVIRIDYAKSLTGTRRDTGFVRNRNAVLATGSGRAGMGRDSQPGPHQNNTVYRFLYDVDSLYAKDSVTVQQVTDAYAARLKEDKINVSFRVNRLDSTAANTPNTVTIGFSKPATFGLSLQHTFGYMLDKLKLPVLFSLLLIGITIAAFVLLYRNMMKQQRLAELKNEFISNITHELKTPIATVGVAIEALKNFNAIHDPARTREYLDISQNELQRLNLLVDKVLKLSVFEKKAIELKKESFDLRQLTEEIMSSMKLQFEKFHAQVNLQAEGGQFIIEADKLHITSVVYNLLDNALKYSTENPVIGVRLTAHPQHVELSVSDNGIGIPAEYKGKVFDKFFRVPTGNKHNIKGYGLGLSYVSEVLKRHHGFITVESELGKGSTFTAHIPYTEAPEIWFDEKRVIKNKRQ